MKHIKHRETHRGCHITGRLIICAENGEDVPTLVIICKSYRLNHSFGYLIITEVCVRADAGGVFYLLFKIELM